MTAGVSRLRIAPCLLVAITLINVTSATAASQPPFKGTILVPLRQEESGRLRATLIVPPIADGYYSWALYSDVTNTALASGILTNTTIITNLTLVDLPMSDHCLGLCLLGKNSEKCVVTTVRVQATASSQPAWIQTVVTAFVGAFLALSGFFIQTWYMRRRDAYLKKAEACVMLAHLTQELEAELSKDALSSPHLPQWLYDPSHSSWRVEFFKMPLSGWLQELSSARRDFYFLKSAAQNAERMSASQKYQLAINTLKQAVLWSTKS